MLNLFDTHFVISVLCTWDIHVYLELNAARQFINNESIAASATRLQSIWSVLLSDVQSDMEHNSEW